MNSRMVFSVKIGKLKNFFASILLCILIGVLVLSDSPDGAFAAQVGKGVNILQDVQPSNLSVGEIKMVLPDREITAFQGDLINIPIKLAAGPDTSKELKLNLEISDSPNPRGKVFSGLFQHWISGGYLACLLNKDGMPAPHTERVTYNAPFTCFLRVHIDERAPQGMYMLRVFATDAKGTLLSEDFIPLAVHEALMLGEASVQIRDGVISVDIRDSAGLPVNADLVILRGNAPGKQDITISLSSENNGSIYSSVLPVSDPAAYMWELRVNALGFKQNIQKVSIR